MRVLSQRPVNVLGGGFDTLQGLVEGATHLGGFDTLQGLVEGATHLSAAPRSQLRSAAPRSQLR